MRFEKRLDNALLTVKIHESMDRTFKAILEGRRHRRDIVSLYVEELRGRGLIIEDEYEDAADAARLAADRQPPPEQKGNVDPTRSGSRHLDSVPSIFITDSRKAALYVLNLAKQSNFTQQQFDALQKKIANGQPINNKGETAEELYESHLQRLSGYVKQIKDYYIQDVQAIMANLHRGVTDKNLKNVVVHLGNAIIKGIGTYNPGLASTDSKPADIKAPAYQSHTDTYYTGRRENVYDNNKQN